MCFSLFMRASRNGVIVFVMTLLYFPGTDSFNIDTKNVQILSGEKESQFGYSLSFNSPKFGDIDSTVSLLVGAPRSPKISVEGIEYPSGSWVTCKDVFGTVQNCKEESIQHRFEGFILENTSRIDEGYGSVFSVSKSGDGLVCAPFWKDVRYSVSHQYSFMPGMCVAFLHREGRIFESIIAPYFGKNYITKTQYFYGLAAFGSSSDVYENSIFAVGSPGLTIFEGGVTIIDCSRQDAEYFLTTQYYKNTLNKTAYGYLGYDVKFGEFCNHPSVCFAAGAPQLYTVGGVRLYLWAQREKLVNFQTLEGEKAWSYFGASLCAVDTDNNAIDELIVGAPYYSDSNSQLDIGKAYVYKRNSISKYFYLHQKLNGKGMKYGRFGSAIQEIGDINVDGFLDVAVGAPGEEEGSGCVYLYLGSTDGLRNDYHQRICAKDISKLKSPLRGFGSTISGPSQSVKNPYPVIAVGAFQSDTILLLYTRPILEVTATLTANPNPLDIDEPCKFHANLNDGPCVVILLCLRHNVREQDKSDVSVKEQYFNITVKIDTQVKFGRPKRAEFISSGKIVDSIKAQVVVEAEGKCLNFIATIKKKTLAADRFTPIEIEAQYELVSDNQHRSSPILDPLAENKIYERITFGNDCGADNICYVDLKVKGYLVNLGDRWNRPNIIIGETKEITALITIYNTQELCYWTEIKVKVSQPLVLRVFTSNKIRQCLPVSDASNPMGTTVVCNYYQLLNSSNIGLMMTFEAENFDMDKKTLVISAEATAKDKEHNSEMMPEDNKIEITSNVFIMSNVQVLGNSKPLEMTLSNTKKISLNFNEKLEERNISSKIDAEDQVILNHKALIKNNGPSFLPKTKVHLNVPVYIPDGTKMVVGTSVQLITGDHITYCASTTKDFTKTTDEIGIDTTTTAITDSALFTVDGLINRRKREAVADDDENQSEMFTLTCDVTPEYCETFVCNLPEVIQPGGHAELNVTLRLDKNNIPMPKDFTTFTLELKTVVEEPDHKLFKPWNASSLQQAMTVTQTSFIQHESGEKINLWIIIGSVIAGLLLVAIIVLVFWKLGFFERKRHFQVQKWRTESMKSRSSQRRKS